MNTQVRPLPGKDMAESETSRLVHTAKTVSVAVRQP